MPAKEASADGCGLTAEIAVGTLARLGLDAEEIEALRRQGFVRREKRGTSTVFKLRFRFRGRQRVKCLGRDSIRISEIKAALECMQADRLLERRLRDLKREAGDWLKKSKLTLLPLVADSAWTFHGRALRRSRGK